jgi:UDP-N-acetyl-2-amino-2-deoxyglucuronate dehydrogenase
MRVGLIGTGAIARLHARAYQRLGWTIRACTDRTAEVGRAFAAEHGAEFLAGYDDVCRHPDVEMVDLCTLPGLRLEPVVAAAEAGKPIQVQKPMATTVVTARRMIGMAREAGIPLGVVSQHRFDDASLFLDEAIRAGRLGRLLQCDAYVKWHRSDEYYARAVKGSWSGEGGGALITQAIHQVDLLRWFAGPVRDVYGVWQVGATHRIESEDIVSAVLRYRNGATGVIQAATAVWPGYPERVELHGTKGTAIITGDRLTTWDVRDDSGSPPPLARKVASGASDPMAIALEPFERQFQDFASAIREGRKPLVSGEEGCQALEVVEAIYRSCRAETPIVL